LVGRLRVQHVQTGTGHRSWTVIGADGRFRMVEMNQRVADNLEQIITALAPGETA